MAPKPTPIYHITHVKNLKSVLACGTLNCKRDMQAQDRTYRNIAHQNIQDRRKSTVVPCGPGGVLHDYVPFYFAPRSPMLFAINCGGVAGCPDGQSPVVHLVSTAQAVSSAGLDFVFTDGHGTMAMTDFYEDLADLDNVDWPVMQLKYWRDTPDDNDRSRRRQAEFLVHESFPWSLVSEVAVMNSTIKATVVKSLEGATHCPPVNVRSAWYY